MTRKEIKLDSNNKRMLHAFFYNILGTTPNETVLVLPLVCHLTKNPRKKKTQFAGCSRRSKDISHEAVQYTNCISAEG